MMKKLVVLELLNEEKNKRGKKNSKTEKEKNSAILVEKTQLSSQENLVKRFFFLTLSFWLLQFQMLFQKTNFCLQTLD